MLLVFGIFRASFFDKETCIGRCLQTSVLTRWPSSVRQATHSVMHWASNRHAARHTATSHEMLNAGAVLIALPPALREHEAAPEP